MEVFNRDSAAFHMSLIITPSAYILRAEVETLWQIARRIGAFGVRDAPESRVIKGRLGSARRDDEAESLSFVVDFSGGVCVIGFSLRGDRDTNHL